MSAALPAAAESPPPGSYQGTCTNIKVQKLLGGPGKNLTATCQKKSGKPVDAVLALPCGGDIRMRMAILSANPGPTRLRRLQAAIWPNARTPTWPGRPAGLMQGKRRVARRYHHQHARLPRPRHQCEAKRQTHLQVRRSVGLGARRLP
jgi:hypothetical protein